MNQPPLLQAEQAYPFVDYMISAGMPAAKYLEMAKLPVALLNHQSGLILERQLWVLLDIVSEHEGIDDFGLQVGLQINVRQQLKSMLPRLMAEPTLLGLLKAFCQMVKEASSDARSWLEPSKTPDKHWFCREGIPSITVGQHEAEQYTLMFMLKLVQLVAGEDWRPTSITLKTHEHHSLDKCSLFQTCRFNLNHSLTAIEIPSYIINRHFFGDIHKDETTFNLDVSIETNPIPTEQLSSSLQEVLPLYLAEKGIELDFVAELLGVSSRTLQRQLAKENTSYAQLIDLIRLNSAIPLLKDRAVKLVDIAYDLGYSDPAHFTRAFKRWAGVSPREYRRAAQPQAAIAC